MSDRLVLSVKEAAAVLGVSTWTLRQYLASGLIRRITLPSTSADHPGENSRRVLIARADLEAFINQHREGAQR